MHLQCIGCAYDSVDRRIATKHRDDGRWVIFRNYLFQHFCATLAKNTINQRSHNGVGVTNVTSRPPVVKCSVVTGRLRERWQGRDKTTPYLWSNIADFYAVSFYQIRRVCEIANNPMRIQRLVVAMGLPLRRRLITSDSFQLLCRFQMMCMKSVLRTV